MNMPNPYTNPNSPIQPNPGIWQSQQYMNSLPGAGGMGWGDIVGWLIFWGLVRFVINQWRVGHNYNKLTSGQWTMFMMRVFVYPVTALLLYLGSVGAGTIAVVVLIALGIEGLWWWRKEATHLGRRRQRKLERRNQGMA